MSCACIYGYFSPDPCVRRCPARLVPARRRGVRTRAARGVTACHPWTGPTVFDLFPAIARKYRLSPDRSLDLAARWRDVIKMTRSHRSLYAKALRAGWQAEDLDQEVLTRVVARAGSYEPDRSSTGRWLFIITRSILLNLLDKVMRKKREMLDLRIAEAHGEADAEADADLLAEIADEVVGGHLPPLAVEVAEHLLAGRRAAEIARIMGVEKREVDRVAHALAEHLGRV